MALPDKTRVPAIDAQDLPARERAEADDLFPAATSQAVHEARELLKVASVEPAAIAALLTRHAANRDEILQLVAVEKGAGFVEEVLALSR